MRADGDPSGFNAVGEPILRHLGGAPTGHKNGIAARADQHSIRISQDGYLAIHRAGRGVHQEFVRRAIHHEKAFADRRHIRNQVRNALFQPG
jgi:hypothetical protein